VYSGILSAFHVKAMVDDGALPSNLDPGPAAVADPHTSGWNHRVTL